MKTVEVTWIDAGCDQSEMKLEEMSKPPRVRTFGLLVFESDLYISVAAEQLEYPGQAPAYRATTHIPRGMIVPRGIRVLERE